MWRGCTTLFLCASNFRMLGSFCSRVVASIGTTFYVLSPMLRLPLSPIVYSRPAGPKSSLPCGRAGVVSTRASPSINTEGSNSIIYPSALLRAYELLCSSVFCSSTLFLEALPQSSTTTKSLASSVNSPRQMAHSSLLSSSVQPSRFLYNSFREER